MYFTYLLGWSKQEKFYYGVRYKDGCGPETLGTSYFSSSVHVKQFIKDHGLPDIVEIRKTFDRKIDAKLWENEVLRRLKVTSKDRWLNVSSNHFKDIVMTEDIKKKISSAKLAKKRRLKMYTDGIVNIGVPLGSLPPDGFLPGVTKTDKQRAHIDKLNKSLTREKRLAAGKKQSKKTKGVKKPEGHGEKVSRALRGKEKPWAKGDKNVSHRDDVKKKISEKLKGRKFYNDGKRLIFVREEDVPEGFVLGKIK